ncbi:MAG: DMT family transporter [Verrucomicrobia bacterium]|nr:DMT family transporter [Verrucomicrobiota bacterium]
MLRDGNRLKAVQMLVLCTVLWALSFPTMKALSMTQQPLVPEAGSWFFTSLGVMYRFGAAGVILLLLSGTSLRKLTRLEVEQGCGLAVFGVGGILFQMDGLAHTSASTSAFLTQCYCILIPLWMALRHRRLPAPQVFVGCTLVLCGVAVLAGVDFHAFRLGRGEVETLIASVLFAGQILWLERPGYAGNDVKRFSTVMFLMMAALCVPLVVGTAPHAAAWVRAYESGAAIGMLALLVGFSTLGGYMLMNHWQRRVTATEAGLIYCAEPVFASLMSLFLPGWYSRWAGIDYANETVTRGLLIGGGLITLANVVLQVADAMRESKSS